MKIEDNKKIILVDGNELIANFDNDKYYITFTNYDGKKITTEIPREIFDTYIESKRVYYRNETYTGALVLGKWENKRYKDRTRRKIEKDKWIRVPHCHTPIISQEIWNIVSDRFKEDGRIKSRKSGEINIFGKKLYCSCCGKAFHMTSGDKRRNQRDYLRCSQSKGTNISIEDEMKEFYQQKLQLEKEINKKSNTLTLLYKDRANAIITAEEFRVIKGKNDVDIETYKVRINSINNSIYELQEKNQKRKTIKNYLKSIKK